MSERADIISGNQVRVETTALGDVPETGMTYSNGIGTDLALNNIEAVLVPAGARTAAPTIATQANLNHRGVLLFLNITASPAVAAASLTLRLQAIEPVSGTARRSRPRRPPTARPASTPTPTTLDCPTRRRRSVA